MTMTAATISRVHFPVSALGPGRRVGVWFQGCSIRCPGCISADTWEPSIGWTTIEEVMATVRPMAAMADGLTVSGGEPFEQPAALAALLKDWRDVSRTSVLVFTGFEFGAVEPWLRENPGLVDAVITGPFRSDQPQTLVMRGSDNQQLHVLTALGKTFAAYERRLEEDDKRLDVMFDADGSAWIAGIPTRGDMGRLRRNLAAEGHRVVLSDQLGGDTRR